MTEAARQDILIEKGADFIFPLVFPYAIDSLSFDAYLLDSEEDKKLTFDVAKDDPSKTVTISADHADYSALENGLEYIFKIRQTDATSFKKFIVVGKCEIKGDASE